MQQSSECLFCNMASGKIPVPKIDENEFSFCIRDIHPQSKVHFLVIPKPHFSSLAEALPSQTKLVGELFETAVRVAKKEGLLPGGFRTVVNTGRDAGQTVHHLHIHVLGGESLKGGFGS